MPRTQVNFYLHTGNIERAVMFYQQNFGFRLEGQIEAAGKNEWAALRTDNALLWLGPSGAKTGLIILIEEKLAGLVEKIKKLGVTIFIPEELHHQQGEEKDIFESDWGKHTWILDSEDNVVMLFEPAAG